MRGFGNNGEDGTEGLRYRNVIATYSHARCYPRTRMWLTPSSKRPCSDVIQGQNFDLSMTRSKWRLMILWNTD